MPQQFLNRSQVGPIGEQMRREGMPERVRMKIPIYFPEPHVFLHEPPDRTLRKSPSRIIQKHSLSVRRPLPPSARGGFLRQQFFAQSPVIVERFLRLRTVRHDALLVAFAAHSQNSFFLIDIDEV